MEGTVVTAPHRPLRHHAVGDLIGADATAVSACVRRADRAVFVAVLAALCLETRLVARSPAGALRVAFCGRVSIMLPFGERRRQEQLDAVDHRL